MSVKDVIKNSVLESFGAGSNMQLPTICLILIAACIVGIYLFFIYKAFSKSAFYSKDLNVTMAGMCIVVAAIMIAMQSNLLVSLGMVGALSIVRFRTAIKNPLDLLFLFWSISAGIICGVGLFALAVVLCIIMTALVALLNRIPTSKAPLVLMLRGGDGLSSKSVEEILSKDCSYWHVSSIITKNNETEFIYEILSKDTAKVVSDINILDGILSVSCLEMDAEIRA